MDNLPGKQRITYLRNSFITSLIVLLLMACGGGVSDILPPSTGKSGELLVLIDTSDWNGVVGKSIKSTFAESYPGLPQDEPYFDIIHIVPRAFTSIFKSTSNIISIEIDPNAKAAFAKKNNVWAENQVYVKIIANNREEAARIIKKNKQALRHLFLDSDFRKLQRTIKRTAGAEQREAISKELGLKLDIPKDFKQVLKSNDAIYFRRERAIREHYVIQALVCYSLPYTDTLDLDTDVLIQRRDSVTKLLVKGAANDEYMTVYHGYPPDVMEYAFQNRYAKELRGLWKMKGAFMGGPFIHFVLVDEVASRVICLDGFVYAPKFDKREYIKELESIIKTVELTKETDVQ